MLLDVEDLFVHGVEEHKNGWCSQPFPWPLNTMQKQIFRI